MTSVEIARRFGLPPKDVIAFIQENATFPVKSDFKTGDISIPDDIDIAAFIAPMLDKSQRDKLNQHQRAIESRIQQEESARQASEGQNLVAVEALKRSGAEGYYQYKVVSMLDIGGLFSTNSGRVNTSAMTQALNSLGMEGWHLVTAYANELGKNAMSGGAGGVMLGVNSTVDENILIFERFIRFK